MQAQACSSLQIASFSHPFLLLSSFDEDLYSCTVSRFKGTIIRPVPPDPFLFKCEVFRLVVQFADLLRFQDWSCMHLLGELVSL